MYGIMNIPEGINSYASQKNAEAAIFKKFGRPEEIEERICNFMIVKNEQNRYVPIAMNIKPGMIGQVAHAGFMCMN